MASKNFKPDKGAKVSGGLAGTFAGAVNELRNKGEVSDTANADAWAKTVNQRDWEHPYNAETNPDGPHD
jgi:DNA gyrase/topoisomerase IV subunit B